MDTSMRDTIIKTYHLETLPKDQQDAMIDKIASLIFQAVLLRVGPSMSNKDQDTLEQMLNDDMNPDELMKFLSRTIPNFETIVIEESLKFKEESDAVMSQLGN